MDDGPRLLKLLQDADKDKDNKQKPPAVAGDKPMTLQPEVAALDNSGRVVSRPATRGKETIPVEVIPMKPWLDGLAKENEDSNVKAVLRAAILQAREQYDTTLNITIARHGREYWVKATELIPTGKLVVPVFVRRDGSMLFSGRSTQVISPQAVNAVVSWPVTEDEKSKGLKDNQVTISVQPECTLPPVPAVAGEASSWEAKHNGHPFWVIPRKKTNEEIVNCEMKSQTTTVVICCSPTPPMDKTAEQTTVTYNVRIPYIVNTTPIAADEKVVLNWQVKEKKRMRRGM